jgi:hypothetical protein
MPLEPAEELELRTTVIRDAAKDSAEGGITVVSVKGPATSPRTRLYTNAQDMFLDLLGSSHGPTGDNSLAGRLFPFVRPRRRAGGRRSPGPGVDVISALLTSGIGDVFLKEFRDCLNPELACYQAVCKTDTIPAKFHSGGCVDPSGYRITIQDFASEPLLSYVLGAGGPGVRTITPVFAYWLDIDLELTAGRVIANPLAADYSHRPDVSLKRTRPDTGGSQQPRKRRVARFTEPFWAR